MRFFLKLDHNSKRSFPGSFVDWINFGGIEKFQHCPRDFEIFRNGQKTYRRKYLSFWWSWNLKVVQKIKSRSKTLNLKMLSNRFETLKNGFPVKFCIDIGIWVSLRVTKSLSALVRPPSLRDHLPNFVMISSNFYVAGSKLELTQNDSNLPPRTAMNHGFRRHSTPRPTRRRS